MRMRASKKSQARRIDCRLAIPLCAAVLLLGGCSLGRLVAIDYRFVNTLSQPAPEASPPLAVEGPLLAAINTATLESDVRYLASAELEGRGRGTPGNALARAYIVSRLKEAGLTPLFEDAFEQRAFPVNGEGEAYAINVGAYFPAARPAAGWIALVAHYDHLGIRGGKVHPGADDNASAMAVLLALGDALGRFRPQLSRHGVLLFPDAEEPPDMRTERMGSSWFWRHPPFPLAQFYCALIFDLMGGASSPPSREAGLGNLVFILGAEASRGLARLVWSVSPEPGVEPMTVGLPLIDAYPFITWRRFARSDYHGLREHGRPSTTRSWPASPAGLLASR